MNMNNTGWQQQKKKKTEKKINVKWEKRKRKIRKLG